MFVAFGFIVMALLIGLSRSLERIEPSLALTLDPLNVEALVLTATEQLNRSEQPSELRGLDDRLRSALPFNVGDARLYSLVGEVLYRTGQTEEAYRYFDHALQLSKAEIHALQRKIVRSIEEADVASAVGGINVLLRRWPEKFDDVAGAFPAILADPDGYASIRAALVANVPWRLSLLRSLGRDPATTDEASRLLLDLRSSAAPPTPDELALVLASYVQQKRYETAYRVFLFTLSEQERSSAGYVFNGSFAPIFSRRPFDWSFPRQSGFELTFLPPGRETGAKLRFFDKPVKGVLLQQYLQVPPGRYRLRVNVSGRALHFPKDLFWSLQCAHSREELGRLEIPEGSFATQPLESSFAVGQADCPAQILRLSSGLTTDSWLYRFSGELTMSDLRIEKLAE